MTGIERHGARSSLGDGRTLEADAVVAGLGIEPNVELAPRPGLPVANGIVVDAFGRVGGREDVFAAGDVARFPVAALGGRAARRARGPRQEPRHGRSARTWPAPPSRYDHLPFFYSDLFDLGYEAVGELDSRLETLAELGRARRARASSTTSTASAARAASCSGTSSAGSTTRAS